MGHSRGSLSWVIIVGQARGSNSLVILGHSLPLVILVPHAPGECAKLRGSRGSRGSFSWVKLVGHSRGPNSLVILGHPLHWSFLCLKLLGTLRYQNCQTILVRL